MMIYTFVIFGSLAALIYAYVSVREGTFINALTPYTAFYFGTSFFLEPVYYFAPTGYYYDTAAFLFIYICDFAYFFGIAVAYTAFRSQSVDASSRVSTEPRPNASALTWLCLGASVLIFIPVAIQFAEFIFTDPRHVYELTRSGFGQYLFVSTFLLNLSFVFFLFSKKRASVIFIPAIIVLSLIKGAKGPVLVILEIFLMWMVYVRQRMVRLKTFSIWVALLVGITASLFSFTFRGVESSELFVAIAGYSDYNRNAALTVTRPIDPKYGQLTFESFVYARIPRFLFPDKRKNFGAFYVSEHYFPEAFDLDQGAPAFGSGVYVADFGILAPAILLLGGLLNGYLLALSMNWLRRGGGIGAFVTMLYFAYVSLIPVPGTFLGLEHWLIGLGVNKLTKSRFVIRSRRASAPDAATRLPTKPN